MIDKFLDGLNWLFLKHGRLIAILSMFGLLVIVAYHA